MKVLLIAAGRRVSLAQRFINKGFEVYSYEIENKCPIASVATIIEGKKWDDIDIRQHIFDTINDIKPDLVLSLSDHATPILSSISYQGVVSASGQTNTICLNKKKFEEYLINEDYYPKIKENELIILKPIKGNNSKGLIKDITYNNYITNYQNSKTHIAQQQIDSNFEISVDAYFNKYSKMIDAVPRKRVEVQGGEVSRSITLHRDSFNVVNLTKEIGEKIGLVGPICAQYIIDQSNNKAYIMEINARLGGGVILSLEAGFDQLQLLIDEYINNIKIKPMQYDWEVNFSMTRYFQEYFYGDVNDIK
jgi:carbamoyl-phosphate synthase large subunit